MGKKIELSGQRFGQLVVVERVPTSYKKNTSWRCKCDCGNEVVARADNLKKGATVSCGCYKMICSITHGYRNHPLYSIYRSMLNRCYLPTTTGYKYWGGRGIKVCPLWRNSFMHFVRFATDNGWQQGLCMDRINNDGDYEPSNVRFTTQKVNNNNKRRSNHASN